MKIMTLKHSLLTAVMLAGICGPVVKAQVTKALNSLVPTDLVDKRSSIFKAVSGIGSSVNINMGAGLKYVDACSDSDFGNLKIDITWHNANDETGKVMLQMMEQMNVAEQDKETFLKGDKGAKRQDFAGGSLEILSSNKPCVNEISGPTGKTQYSTEAKYFSFKNNTVLKITLNNKMKPETAKNVISKIADDVAKFDFSVYSNTVASETN